MTHEGTNILPEMSCKKWRRISKTNATHFSEKDVSLPRDRDMFPPGTQKSSGSKRLNLPPCCQNALVYKVFQLGKNKSPKPFVSMVSDFCGPGCGTRTHGLLVPNQARYQTSLSPVGQMVLYTKVSEKAITICKICRRGYLTGWSRGKKTEKWGNSRISAPEIPK